MDTGLKHFATIETSYDGEDFYAEVLLLDGSVVSGYGVTESEAVLHALRRTVLKLETP